MAVAPRGKGLSLDDWRALAKRVPGYRLGRILRESALGYLRWWSPSRATSPSLTTYLVQRAAERIERYPPELANAIRDEVMVGATERAAWARALDRDGEAASGEALHGDCAEQPALSVAALAGLRLVAGEDPSDAAKAGKKPTGWSIPKSDQRVEIFYGAWMSENVWHPIRRMILPRPSTGRERDRVAVMSPLPAPPDSPEEVALARELAELYVADEKAVRQLLNEEMERELSLITRTLTVLHGVNPQGALLTVDQLRLAHPLLRLVHSVASRIPWVRRIGGAEVPWPVSSERLDWDKLFHVTPARISDRRSVASFQFCALYYGIITLCFEILGGRCEERRGAKGGCLREEADLNAERALWLRQFRGWERRRVAYEAELWGGNRRDYWESYVFAARCCMKMLVRLASGSTRLLVRTWRVPEEMPKWDRVLELSMGEE